MKYQHSETENLKDEITHIESETRMILPGVQTLFGFQLVTVFNDRFAITLNYNEQVLHWGAIACSAVSAILVISPAAYHRLAEPHTASRRFTHFSNLWLKSSLFPLALGCVIDFFLIGIAITKNYVVSGIVSSILFIGFITAWYIFPLLIRRKLP
ncbi:DUF6328 family protein [Bdellovibrio sp. BCCA]|uniref:DUF6328 family protein n=1 Tax=Bdellovibrio sp. BCCA TaxID=3136281 RepID=UPI0030F00B90